MLKLREKLLVEKCINNILRDHTTSIESVKIIVHIMFMTLIKI